MSRYALVLAFAVIVARPVAAQDTLGIGEAQRAALASDPRGAEYELLERQAELRLGNLSASRLPQLAATGEATYQSEVTTIPIEIPGTEPPQPPKDRVEVALNAEWLAYDGGATGAQRDVEAAALVAAQARLAAQLEPLRAEVNDAFFGALALQQQSAETGALIAVLAARLEETRAAVSAGAALPGDTAALLAELLVASERQRALAAEEEAALATLSRLTGADVADATVLALPDLSAEVERARAALAGEPDSVLAAHPQLAAFAAERARLERQADALRAQTRPQSSLFGRLGYGWPGFEQFTDEPHEYWIGGVRVHWAPFDWGRTSREREVLEAQQAIVAAEADAFANHLLRAAEAPLAAIDRLRATLAVDDRIIVLRSQVVDQAEAQFRERSITSSTYVDALADLEQARAARVLHRVQLARAEAAYLTLLGISLP